jgi:ADP-ribose pyrophosphatase YjhB (NUDIX family)
MAEAGARRAHSYCSYCGHAFEPGQPWPRRCSSCGATTYRNPLPVAVVLLPVDHGLLVVRRSIPPRVGELALPGGFVNYGESWQEAGAREVAEETGLQIDPAQLRIFDALSAPEGMLLVFGLAPRMRAADLPPFVPNAEASERLLMPGPAELAFPLHTLAAGRYFAEREA